MTKVWFITGCSTGIGRLLAERVHARGERVVATARDPQSLAPLGAADDSRIARLPLDVTQPEQVRAAVAAAVDRFGALDVVVNNAGYGYFSTQEEAQLDDVRAMFETNVFGLVRVTQAVLPHLRERGAGTIVNLSSIAGRIGTPRGGFYQASKWAVEALSESLSHEVASFGIRVVAVEPGRYASDFATRSLRVGPHEQDADSPYAALRATWTANASQAFPGEPQDTREVIDAIERAVASSEPFLRVPVGRDTAALLERRERDGDAAFVDWLRRLYHEGPAGT